MIAQPFANHNGGMLEFGPDGFLYIGMGDGGSGNDPGNRAQDIDELLGKILRIDVDHPDGTVPYSSPPTNPFFGATPGRDEIYADGMRNPWRFSFDRADRPALRRRRRPGRAARRSTSSRSAATTAGASGRARAAPASDPRSAAQPASPSRSPSTRTRAGRCSVTGGYVYRGSRATLPAGTVRLRRLLHRRDLPRSRAGRRASCSTPGSTSPRSARTSPASSTWSAC